MLTHPKIDRSTCTNLILYIMMTSPQLGRLKTMNSFIFTFTRPTGPIINKLDWMVDKYDLTNSWSRDKHVCFIPPFISPIKSIGCTMVRGVFRTQWNIYDGAFERKKLTAFSS